MKLFSIVTILLRIAYPCDCAIEHVLNIRDNEGYVRRFEDMDEFYNHHTLFPDFEAHIKKVIDDNQTIWEANSSRDEECICLIVSIFDGEYRLIRLNLLTDSDKSDFYYFRTSHNIWCEVNEDTYVNIFQTIVYGRKLNISHYSNNTDREITYTLFGNEVSVYTPLVPTNIIEVADDTDVLWSGDLDYNICNGVITHSVRGILKLLLITIEDYGRSKIKYYSKGDDNKWYRIEEERYSKMTHRLENECSLDILNHNRNDACFHSQFHHPYGIPSMILTTKLDKINTEVVYGIVPIWKAQENEKCAYASIHFRDLVPVLLQLHVETIDSHGDIFYERKEDLWFSIESDVYYELLEKFDKEEDQRNLGVK